MSPTWKQIVDHTKDGLTVSSPHGALTPLAHWKAVRGLTASRQVNAIVIGASIDEGYGLASRDQRWADKMVASLRSTYASGAAGGTGFEPCEYVAATIGDRWTFGGTTLSQSSSATWGFGYRIMRLASAATATLTFTGTGVDIWISRGTSTVTPTITVDGVAYTLTPSTLQNQPAAMGPYSVPFKIRGLSSGSHTLVITSAGNYAYLEGATVFDGDEAKGLVQYDAAHSGFRAVDAAWRDTTPSYLSCYGAVPWDLVLINLGGNDYGSNGNMMPPHAVRTSLVHLVNEIRKRCAVKPSFVLFIPTVRGDAVTSIAPVTDYNQAVVDAATILGGDVTTWDPATVMPSFAAANTAGYFQGDGLHLTATGHTAFAGGITTLLTA